MFTPRRLLVVATAVALLSGCASPNPYDGAARDRRVIESERHEQNRQVRRPRRAGRCVGRVPPSTTTTVARAR